MFTLLIGERRKRLLFKCIHKLIWQNSTSHAELEKKNNRNEEQFPSSDMVLKKMVINYETKDFSVTLETGMMTSITVTI